MALRKTQHHCQPQIWVWPDINCLETISNTSLNLPPQKVFPVYGQFFFFNLGNKRLTVRIHSLDTVTGNKYKHTQQVGKEGWHWHHLSLSKVQPELRMWIMSLSNSSLKRFFCGFVRWLPFLTSATARRQGQKKVSLTELYVILPGQDIQTHQREKGQKTCMKSENCNHCH